MIARLPRGAFIERLVLSFSTSTDTTSNICIFQNGFYRAACRSASRSRASSPGRADIIRAFGCVNQPCAIHQEGWFVFRARRSRALNTPAPDVICAVVMHTNRRGSRTSMCKRGAGGTFGLRNYVLPRRFVETRGGRAILTRDTLLELFITGCVSC